MATETEEEQKAREEAQARRQRILDGAGSRMDVVEGVQQSDGSKASKLAAMRRRRFKKKTEVSEETVPPDETVTIDDDNVETKEAAPEQEMQETVVLSVESIADTTEETTTPDGGETKKKYMGVAKMRRMKLKEKQLEEKDETSAEASTTTTYPSKKQRKFTPRLPIIMHIVTILLLFVAGLDIGLQQVGIDYRAYDGTEGSSSSVLKVHHDFAPRNLGGVAFLISKLSEKETFVRGGDVKKVRLLEKSTNENIIQPIAVLVNEESDEFIEVDDENTMKGVVDPLFGVDLDKLTAGPGPVQWGARQAVKCHRLLLRIFYYGPIHSFKWLIACMTSPPIFCLMALLIRQLVGKVILGAALPDAKKDDEEQKKDVMSMVQTFVTKFLLSSFPTAASLYDVWCHLRADIYVLLCGFFFGLAFSHTPAIATSSLFAGFFNQTSSSDEL